MTEDKNMKFDLGLEPISYQQLLETIARSDVSIFTTKKAEPYKLNEIHAVRWKDIWEEKLYFKEGALEYRAVAFSIPAIHHLQTTKINGSRIIGMDRNRPEIKIFNESGVQWISKI